MTVLAHPLNIIMHSKKQLIADPLEENLTALARPQLLGTENGFWRKWDKM